MQLVKRIGEGEMYPCGYGIAWREWDLNQSACMPVPLNIVCGLARRAYVMLRDALRTPTQRDKIAIVAHLESYRMGRDAERERMRRFR